ncbi:MAG: quinolinate synthase NadA [Peptococcia bacterium]
MSDLNSQILNLKKECKAVILAHNYQIKEIQEIADYVGDSFYLSKIAASTENEVIVFCGVRFMAETAKILAPEKIILLPEIEAGCPLAEMITVENLQKLRAEHPDAAVVCYINSSTEVKALSDVCCTSANAVKVVRSLPEKKVIFIPDQNLGNYVAKQVPEKELILGNGYCPVHAQIKPEDIAEIREKYPQAEILVHPECAPHVADLADFIGSTSEIIRYAQSSKAKICIIGTEKGVLYKLQASCPKKDFYFLHPHLICADMKKTNLQSVYNALYHKQYEINVDKRIAEKAKQALGRMLELA